MSCCISLVLRLFCFVSFSFFLLSLKPRPFVQSFFVLRYACAPTATRSYHCLRPFSFLFLPFFFSLLWRRRFFRIFLYHYRFMFVWRVRRTFFPSGWCFSTLWPRAGFLVPAYVIIQLIKKNGVLSIACYVSSAARARANRSSTKYLLGP